MTRTSIDFERSNHSLRSVGVDKLYFIPDDAIQKNIWTKNWKNDSWKLCEWIQNSVTL